MKRTCTGCTIESVEFKSSSNVGEQKTRSGFFPLMSCAGHIHWLCPACWEKARGLAAQLMEIVKDNNLYFPGLLK